MGLQGRTWNVGPELGPGTVVAAGSPSGSLAARARGMAQLALGSVQAWAHLRRLPPFLICRGTAHIMLPTHR